MLGGREQKTEGKAPLLHHAQIRTSAKNSLLSSLKQRSLRHIVTDFFFTVHFNVVRMVKMLSTSKTPLGYLLLNTVGFC